MRNEKHVIAAHKDLSKNASPYFVKNLKPSPNIYSEYETPLTRIMNSLFHCM